MLQLHELVRDWNAVVVERKSAATLLFFSYPVNVTFAVEEFQFEKIVSRAMAGDFREMRNAY